MVLSSTTPEGFTLRPFVFLDWFFFLDRLAKPPVFFGRGGAGERVGEGRWRAKARGVKPPPPLQVLPRLSAVPKGVSNNDE